LGEQVKESTMPAQGANEKDIQPATEAGPESQKQPDDQPVQDSIVQAAQPALEELRTRMAQVVQEQKGQTADDSPSGEEEQQPRQQAEQQTTQQAEQASDSASGSDQEQGARRTQEMRPETSRSDDDGQGDKTMATDNPKFAAREGLLRMARQWRDTGSTHQAVEAYKEILINYPGTQVAAAAVQELVELAQMMENQGQFHSALEVFRMMEQLGVDR
jgi:hypothetical protein